MEEKRSYLVCIDGDWHEYTNMTFREVVLAIAGRFIDCGPKSLLKRCIDRLDNVDDIVAIYNIFARDSGYYIEKIFELGYKVYDSSEVE